MSLINQANFDGVVPNVGSHGVTLLTAGLKQFVIRDIQNKVTKEGDGQYAEIKFEVVYSENNDELGKTVYERLNLVNKTPATVRIATEQLLALMLAAFGRKCSDEELLSGPTVNVFARVGPKKGDAKVYENKFFYIHRDTDPATFQPGQRGGDQTTPIVAPRVASQNPPPIMANNTLRPAPTTNPQQSGTAPPPWRR